MIKISNIIDKIDARIKSIQNEDKSKYPDDYKQHLSVEEAVYRRIKSEIEFQSLSSVEKQSKRIEYLASCRKANGNCENKLKTDKTDFDIKRNILEYQNNLLRELKKKEIEYVGLMDKELEKQDKK